MDIISGEPLDACTARRLSESTGINRAYIHFWFGGKTGLFRSAEAVLLERIAEQIARDGRMDVRHPDISTAARLSAYLCIHDPGFVYSERRPVIDAVMTNLKNEFGLPDEQALLIAKWFVGSLLAANVFDAQLDALKDLDAYRDLAFSMVELVATSNRNASGNVENGQSRIEPAT